jgi:hypothetical protein
MISNESKTYDEYKSEMKKYLIDKSCISERSSDINNLGKKKNLRAEKSISKSNDLNMKRISIKDEIEISGEFNSKQLLSHERKKIDLIRIMDDQVNVYY